MHVDDHRIYVHAGLDPELPLDRQTEQTLLWKRYPDDETGGFRGRHIVHGHDSFADGPKLFEGRSNLDTKAWRTGRLVIAVFDDAVSGGPIEILTVQGAPEGRANLPPHSAHARAESIRGRVPACARGLRPRQRSASVVRSNSPQQFFGMKRVREA